MGFKSAIKSLFGKVKSVVSTALGLLEKAGLDDEVVEFALKYVKTAAVKFADNNERREWVVRALIEHKVPEQVARVAVELAYKLFKQRVSDRLDAELAKQAER